LLLSGKADYVLVEDGVEKTIPLKVGMVTSVDAGVPHIMVVHEDITTFEWWDGDFIAEPAGKEFKKYTATTIGPEDFLTEEV
jgi:transposase